jgi:xylulokinase
MYTIGYDIGSSSVKATLLDTATGQAVGAVFAPESEMEITAVRQGWAEQDPEMWWQYLKETTRRLLSTTGVNPSQIKAIGISYQMHGLVVVDREHRPLRPSIIWCDSRAVQIGDQAFAELGEDQCLKCYLNSPGNFTASKLKWVKENEPEIYDQIYKFMLPGDFIALKLSGQIQTTASGLSEGILWDFNQGQPAYSLLEHYGIDAGLLPEIVPTFGIQAQVSDQAATETGLHAGTLITYRAGDQPNNAFSLNVLRAGEVATTAGTSGVMYGINNAYLYDDYSRVNTFLHVNHTPQNPSVGSLLCINGTGVLNSWLRRNVFSTDQQPFSYQHMNELAAAVPPGSEGLQILPFGNGAERILRNKEVGASFHGLAFNNHSRAHLARAAQEGIVFALRYGFDIMRDMNIRARTVKAGDANMFLSPLFAQTFATVTNTTVELYNTDGSQGAARGAAVGAGLYSNFDEAFAGLSRLRTIEPETGLQQQYEEVYQGWRLKLETQLEGKL